MPRVDIITEKKGCDGKIVIKLKSITIKTEKKKKLCFIHEAPFNVFEMISLKQ